jgi:hypothetical protein
MRSVMILFIFVLLVTSAIARIGETPIQFVDRYGRPKDTPSSKIYDKNSPVLEGAVHHTYECVRGGSLLGLRDNAKIRLRSLPPLWIEPFGFVV